MKDFIRLFIPHIRGYYKKKENKLVEIMRMGDNDWIVVKYINNCIVKEDNVTQLSFRESIKQANNFINSNEVVSTTIPVTDQAFSVGYSL